MINLLRVLKLSSAIESTSWCTPWLSSLLVWNTVHRTSIILSRLRYYYCTLVCYRTFYIICSRATLSLISFILMWQFILNLNLLFRLLKIRTVIQTDSVLTLIYKINVSSRDILSTLRMIALLLILNNWTSTPKYTTSLNRENSWNILWT